MRTIKLETRTKLSLLWLVIMLNMIFADIFSIIIEFIEHDQLEIPGDVKTIMAIAAVITNIPILMILFSRILNYKWNRIANISAALFTMFYVVGGGSLTPHYIVIGSIEIVLLIAILITSFKWKEID